MILYNSMVLDYCGGEKIPYRIYDKSSKELQHRHLKILETLNHLQ